MWRRSSGVYAGRGANRLQPLLEEALGRRVRDVHVLGAQRARVGFLERRDDVGQPHPGRTRLERPDVEFGRQVAFREAVGPEVEVGQVLRLVPLERVEIGVVHPQRAELADEPKHQHLLVHRRRIDHRPGDLAVSRQLDERRNDRGMGDVGRVAAQFVEVRAPLRTDGVGVGKVVLVQLLDERDVRPEEGGARLEFLHAAHAITFRDDPMHPRDGGGTHPRQPPCPHLRPQRRIRSAARSA